MPYFTASRIRFSSAHATCVAAAAARVAFRKSRRSMLVLLLLTACAAPQRFEQSRVLMGTRARVVLCANDRAEAQAAADAALDRIAELEAVMSDGVRYSHLVDPRTGLGLTHGIAVTVIVPAATEADAWASAASVLGRAPAKRPGYEYTFQR